jgi:glycerate 2-kinase
MPSVLLAPDKFKGTLSAAEVAAHLARGIQAAAPRYRVQTVPVSDGGDGLLEVARACAFELVGCRASGPTGERVEASYAMRGTEAVIEMAEVCGLTRLPGGVLRPMSATSRGLGEVIAAALDEGCTSLLVGIGGSASTDGGVGMVQALGARALDAAGHDVGPGGAGVADIDSLAVSGLHPRLPDARISIACDVDNPLTGPSGAATVYGPQKGADPGQVVALDRALASWADVVADVLGSDLRDSPGAGAAGGVGFAALTLLGATLRSGVDVVFELTRFHDALALADLVITGEGSLDEQTLHGKAPSGVAEAAKRAGVPVVAVAGRCLLTPQQLADAGIERAYALVEEADDPDEAFSAPGPLLERIGATIAARMQEVTT